MLGFVKDLAQDMDVKADYQRLVTERDFQHYREHVILSKLLASSPEIPNFRITNLISKILKRYLREFFDFAFQQCLLHLPQQCPIPKRLQILCHNFYHPLPINRSNIFSILDRQPTPWVHRGTNTIASV
jgi:hypothetical protein